jgi:hypothetical protein
LVLSLLKKISSTRTYNPYNTMIAITNCRVGSC